MQVTLLSFPYNYGHLSCLCVAYIASFVVLEVRDIQLRES